MADSSRPRRLTITPAEAAELLGIPEWTVRNAMRKGQLPSVPIGRRRLLPLAKLEAMFGVGDPPSED